MSDDQAKLQSALPLGREVDYPRAYDDSLLYPIPRLASREALGIDTQALPFAGVDIWNAYELSWLDLKGKPVVAHAELRVPADSPAMIESKSLKLYLNSLNQERLESREAAASLIRRDLSAVAGCQVDVLLSAQAHQPVPAGAGHCLDDLPLQVEDYQYQPEALTCAEETVEEALYSHLLRSLCPVTGQPDWATVHVHYKGRKIDRLALLRYIVGYREHQEFHEQCVERFFCDIWQRCEPEFLAVSARYLRRGGLDINPCRSSDDYAFENRRLLRQ